MKKILLVLLTLIIVVSGCGISVESESTTVPKLMEMTVTYADESTQKREYVYEPTASWPAKACDVYENGVLLGREEYSYDEKYNTTKITQNWEGGNTQVFEYTYGENGLMSSKTLFQNDVEEYTIIYTYDTTNHIVEMKEFHDDVLFQYTQIKYDENGHRQTQTLFSGTDEVISYFNYVFDEKKLKETAKEYTSDGTLVGYLVNQYNNMNVITQEEAFNPDDSLISHTYWKYIPQEMGVTVIGY